MKTQSNNPIVYFGGAREIIAIDQSQAALVLQRALVQGANIHTGCQRGVDQFISQATPFARLSIFCVRSRLENTSPHIQSCSAKGARVVLAAGGNSAILFRARYLLRSIAALAGCSRALFFAPGTGSLAVIREAVKVNIPVFTFQISPPPPVPSTAGHWVKTKIYGQACFRFSTAQKKLF